MSLLSPGEYLRSLLVELRYDVRDAEGRRLMSVTAQEADALQAKDLVWGRLSNRGELQYLAAMYGKPRIKAALANGLGQPVAAEDNRTVVRDLPMNYSPHPRRAKAFRRRLVL